MPTRACRTGGSEVIEDDGINHAWPFFSLLQILAGICIVVSLLMFTGSFGQLRSEVDSIFSPRLFADGESASTIRRNPTQRSWRATGRVLKMPAANQPVRDIGLSSETPRSPGSVSSSSRSASHSSPSRSDTLSQSASFSASASLSAAPTARQAPFPSKTASRSVAPSSSKAQLRSEAAAQSSSQAQLSSQSAAPSASKPVSPSESPASHALPVLPYVPGETVDIVVLSDPAYAIGVAAIISAARKHTKLPVRVFIGFDGDPSTLHAYLECLGMSTENVTVRRSVPLVEVADLPKAVKGRERLQCVSNYARFTIHRTFPELRVAFYLDVDALPISDLSSPIADFEKSGTPLRPTGRRNMPVNYAFIKEFDAAYRQRYGVKFDGGAPSFNAGVWLADFALWAKHDVDTEALYWVKANAARVSAGLKPFWELATQPVTYAIFNRDVTGRSTFLEREWNCDASSKLADRKAKAGWPPQCKISLFEVLPIESLALFASLGCCAVHWLGKDKPWMPASAGHVLWAKYLPHKDGPKCLGELHSGGGAAVQVTTPI